MSKSLSRKAGGYVGDEGQKIGFTSPAGLKRQAIGSGLALGWTALPLGKFREGKISQFDYILLPNE